MVEKAFGDWQKGTPAQTRSRRPDDDEGQAGAGRQARRAADAVAGRRRSACRATRRDYEPHRVMNESLGGLFSSRINLNLREEHGYTYGASSQFVFRRAPGPFLVATGVRTDVTGPAVAEIHEGAQTHSRKRRVADELTLSKDSLVRSMAADFETSGAYEASTANIIHLRSGPRLLFEARRQDVGRDDRAGARRGAEVRRPREARGGGGWRQGQSRSCAREAESRGYGNVERRRDARFAGEVDVGEVIQVI